MSFLLDTHAFLWSVLDPKRLGGQSRAVVSDSTNDVYISAVTFWEISIKIALDKLHLDGCGPETLLEAARTQSFEVLPLSPEDAATFHRLPRTGHKDPFDRMLIWQAIRGSHTLITQDGGIQRAYHVHGLVTIW